MNKSNRILLILGVLLVLLSAGGFLVSNLYAGWAGENAEIVASQIRDLLPARTVGVQEPYTNPQMPVLQFDGKDYVCLVEVPAYGVSLPVRNEWKAGSLLQNPCRFWGSSYDGTLILGGSNQQGQFDFCGRVDLGDRITVTDMEGAVFTYAVERIDRSKTADFDRLSQGEYSLTLFTQEPYSAYYIIVRCNAG